MELEDEYIRNYVFDPEFITRKDSIDMHKERIDNVQKRTRKLARQHSLDLCNLSEEEITLKLNKNLIEAEVHSFSTVNMMRKALKLFENLCDFLCIEAGLRQQGKSFELALKIGNTQMRQKKLKLFSTRVVSQARKTFSRSKP